MIAHYVTIFFYFLFYCDVTYIYGWDALKMLFCPKRTYYYASVLFASSSLILAGWPKKGP